MEKLSNTPTYKLLSVTKKEYETMVFSLMFNWADLYGKGDIKATQKLLSNRLINKWFLAEYVKLLKEFKNCLKPYLNKGNISKQDKQKLWLNITTRMYDIYPKALITKVNEL